MCSSSKPPWPDTGPVGPVNYFLSQIGVRGPRWLASQEWALPTRVGTARWGSVGPLHGFALLVLARTP